MDVIKNKYPGGHIIEGDNGSDMFYSAFEKSNLMFGIYNFDARFVFDRKTDKLSRVILTPSQKTGIYNPMIVFGYVYAKLETIYGPARIIDNADEGSIVTSPKVVWNTDNSDLILGGWWMTNNSSSSLIIDNKTMLDMY